MNPNKLNWISWPDVAAGVVLIIIMGLLALLLLSIQMRMEQKKLTAESKKKWEDIAESDKVAKKVREIDARIKGKRADYSSLSSVLRERADSLPKKKRGRNEEAEIYEDSLESIRELNSVAKHRMLAEVKVLEEERHYLMYPESLPFKPLTEVEQMALKGKMPPSISPEERTAFYRKWRWDQEVKAGFEIESEFERRNNTFFAGAPDSYNWRNMPFQDNSFYEYKNSFRDYFTLAAVIVLIVYVAVAYDNSPTYMLTVKGLFILAASSWIFDTFDKSWRCAVIPCVLYLVFAHCGLIHHALPYILEWMPNSYVNTHYGPLHYKVLYVTFFLDRTLKYYLVFLLLIKEGIEWFQNDRSFIWRRLAHAPLFDLKRRTYEGYADYLKNIPCSTYFLDQEWKAHPRHPNKDYVLERNGRNLAIILTSITAVIIVVKWYFFGAPFPTIAIWLWFMIRLFKYFDSFDASWFVTGVYLALLSVAWHYNLAAEALDALNSHYPHLKGDHIILSDISKSPWKWRFVLLDIFLIQIFALIKAKENMDLDLWETSFHERALLTPFDLRRRTESDGHYNPWLINLDRGLPRDSEAWREEPYLLPRSPYRLKRSPRNYAILGLLGWLIYMGIIHGHLFIFQDQTCFFVLLALLASCLFEEYDWSWHLALLFTATYARITHLGLLHDFLEYFWEDFYEIAGPAVRAEMLEVWIGYSHVVYAALMILLLVYKIVKSDGFVLRKLTGRIFDLEIISRY